MKITLLTGSFENDKDTCYSLEKVNNQLYIDIQLEKLLALKCDIDVVLGYKHSDEIMRNSLLLKNCDPVFDPNELEGSRLSNLFAGLYATHGECFFLPIQYMSPSEKDWKKIINRLYQVANDGFDVLRPYCPIDGKMSAGYPLGVSRSGKMKLMSDRSINNINEADLKEYKLPILDSSLTHPYIDQNNLQQV